MPMVYGNVAGKQRSPYGEGFVEPVKRCSHCCREFPRRFLREGFCPECRTYFKALKEWRSMIREAAHG